MTKPRDVLGNDLIVPCTAIAMQIARAAGLEKDMDLVRKLSFGLYKKELERIKGEDNGI